MLICRGSMSTVITAHIVKCWDGRRKLDLPLISLDAPQSQDVGAPVRSEMWTLGGQRVRSGAEPVYLWADMEQGPGCPTE